MSIEAIKNRYDFAVIFDVENGNPNGDPDAGNMPRTDAETGHGIVTDVCLKRKIRNYIELTRDDNALIKNAPARYKIFIKEILNDKLEEAYAACNIEKKTKKAEEVKLAQRWMCANYYDVRTFGAVMSTGDCPCGVLRGPVQINFAKSIDPVAPQEITITRMAKTDKARAEKGETEMGKKNYIPYALYKAEGFISAALAEKTGFSDADLKLLWEAVINMFEHDRSAARGKMVVRKLIVFKHESTLGNSPSHKLLDRVVVERKIKDSEMPARQYSDYAIMIDRDNLPEGVEIHELV
jgi:CRISPR-associated protein Csd2